jgi:DNA repair protein RecO (recombination protein O)
VGLATDLERYASACALAEVMLRFAPPDPHPESFDLLQHALEQLETAASPEVEALGFRVLWQLVSVLGFAPSLDACVIDGTPLPGEGPLPFSTRDGGALCPTCAAQHGATQLPAAARSDLVTLLDAAAPLPSLDARHGAAHRRLLARYIRYHLGEGADLPALEFWTQRAWAAA